MQTYSERYDFFDRFRSFSSTAIDRGIGIGRFGVEKIAENIGPCETSDPSDSESEGGAATAARGEKTRAKVPSGCSASTS